jgi:type IV secretory pathway VirB4 component
MWRGFRVPAAHRDTTAVLGGAYPFLAGPPTVGGGYIGRDTVTGAAFGYDPWHCYAAQAISNTNILIVGNIGWGKTNTAMAIALRGIATGRPVTVPGDPKDDWSRIAEALGGQAIRLGAGQPDRLNPLDPGPQPPGADRDTWLHQADQRRAALLVAIVESLAPGLAPLHPQTLEALTDALQSTCRASSTPTLHQLVARLEDNPAPAGAPIRASLAQLCIGPMSGLLDQPATVTPDPAAPMIAVGTAALADNDLAHTLAVLTATSQLEQVHTTGEQRFLVYDEAWRILAAPAHLARVNAELRLSRARGTATILITHALSDADKTSDAGSAAAATARGLASLCDTRIAFRQAPGELDRTATDLHLTRAERDAVAALGKGEALWKIGTTGRRVHTDLGESETVLFNTDAAIAGSETPSGAPGVVGFNEQSRASVVLNTATGSRRPQ